MGLGRFLQKVVRPSGNASPAPAQGVIQRAIQGAAAQNVASKAPSNVMPPPGVVRGVMQAARGMRFNKGGSVSSGRGDGIAVRGKTKCKMY